MTLMLAGSHKVHAKHNLFACFHAYFSTEQDEILYSIESREIAAVLLTA